MIVIFISDYLGVKTKGHQNYEFVDAFLNGDNQLFTDPCMIEGAEDPGSKNAANIMSVFFDCIFEGLREKTLYTSGLLNTFTCEQMSAWGCAAQGEKAHQYLYSVIIERIRKANGWDDLKKVDIWSKLPRISEHWEYDTVIVYTREHPEALSEYHDHMPRFYRIEVFL